MIDYEQIRSALKIGDVIVYKSLYAGWRSARVTKPNPTFITAENGERVYYRRIEGVGSSLEAAQATVALLQRESDAHRRNDEVERARHLAAIRAILDPVA